MADILISRYFLFRCIKSPACPGVVSDDCVIKILMCDVTHNLCFILYSFKRRKITYNLIFLRYELFINFVSSAQIIAELNG